MNKLNLTILKSENNKLESLEKKIRMAISRAEDFAINYLKIVDNINIVFIDNNDFRTAIPEDGIGGRTFTGKFIVCSIDTSSDISEQIIYEMVCHELTHAVRWQKNPEFTTCLFDEIIMEGLATFAESLAVKDSSQKQFFMKTVLKRSDKENQKIFKTLKPILDGWNYDRDELLFDGNDEIPRWSGYSLGFYLVKKYMDDHDLALSELILVNYCDFRDYFKI